MNDHNTEVIDITDLEILHVNDQVSHAELLSTAIPSDIEEIKKIKYYDIGFNLVTGVPLQYRDPQEFKTLVDSYFIQQDDLGAIYTLTGLALHIGLTKAKMQKIKEQYANKTDEANWISIIIEYAEERVFGQLEERALNNKVNQAVAMFWAQAQGGLVKQKGGEGGGQSTTMTLAQIIGGMSEE